MFSLFAGLAIVVGVWYADKRASQLGLERSYVSSAMTWAFVGGLAFTHIFDVLAYRTTELLAAPMMIVDLSVAETPLT
jgi:prolipoprotein diacylglyceryltransferase